LGSSLVGGRPLFSPGWLTTLALLGLVALHALEAIEEWQRGRRGWRLAISVLASLAFLTFMPLGSLRFAPSKTVVAEWDVLAETPVLSSSRESRLGLLDWNQNALAYCVALEQQPADEARAARIETLSKLLVAALDDGHFIPDETLNALVDVGALTPQAGIALLTHPRGADDRESEIPLDQGAREWLRALARRSPGSGLNYAAARALLQLAPGLPGLRESLEASLRTKLPGPGRNGSVSSLRNALVLAELAGLTECAAELRTRIAPTLQAAWIDRPAYGGREVGWTASPEGDAEDVDVYETRLALDLLQRGGIPPGVDLGGVWMTMLNEVGDRWHDEGENSLAAATAAILEQRWPGLAGPRFQLTDALILVMAVLVVIAVIDVRRLPMPPPGVTPSSRPATATEG
jgi:hypothetical protein